MKVFLRFYLLCFLIAVFSISLAPGISGARNADFSEWIENISESPLPSEPGFDDTAPEIEVSGSTVHVLWNAYNRNSNEYFLYYRRSANGGRSWEDKKLLYTGDVYLGNRISNRMAVDGNTVHIFFTTTLGSGGDWSGTLFYRRSRNSGASFEATRTIITGRNQRISNVYADSGNGRVTVAYDVSDWTNAKSILGFASNNNGTDFRQFEAYPAVNTAATIWDMRAEGDNIYIAFTVARGYPGGGYDLAYEMFMAVSHSRGGAAGLETPFKLYRISVPSAKKDSNGNGVHKTYFVQDEHYVPKIALDGSNVYVTWSGLDGNDISNVFFARSTDNGTTFENTATATRNLLAAGRTVRWGMETIVAKDGYGYLVFLTEGGQSIIHMRRSIDGGNSFYGIQNLSASPDVPFSGGWWPVVQTGTNGEDVHVFWTGGGYVHSSDGGANFTSPVRLNKLFGTSIIHRPQIAVGEDGALHHVVEGTVTHSGGYFSDPDILYRRHEPFALDPSAENMALDLHYIKNNGNGIEEYDNMQIPASPDVNFSNAMTLEAWIMPFREANVEGFAVVKRDPELNWAEGSYALGQWRDGHANARITTTDNGFHMGGSEPLANEKWHHLAMTYDAGAGEDNFRLYVNGELVGATTATGNLDTREGIIFVGSTDRYRYANVIIDELRFWNRALSQGEIKSRMNIALLGNESGLTAYYNFDETSKDITGNGNDGIFMFSESFVPGGPIFIPEPPDVNVTIPAINVSSGKDFNVNIDIENDSVIFGANVVITYDSDLMLPKDVKMGEAFGDMNISADFSTLGKVSLDISTNGISGDGTLATIVFTSGDVANEEAAVEFESFSVTDVNGLHTNASSSESGAVNIFPIPDVKLTIPEIKTSSGKDFGVPIALEDESIIFGAKIEVNYDNTLVTPIDAKMGEAFGDMEIVPDFSTPGKAVIEISGDGVTGSGTLVDMTFTANDAINQESPFEFGQVLITDVSGEEMTASSLQDGKAEIVPVPDVKLTIPEIKTSPGKDFEVPISLEDESIIFVIKFEVNYDSDVMIPIDNKLGESFQDKGMDLATDLSVPGKATIEITADGVTGSGSLVDMTFASDNAANKEAAVEFGNIIVTDANGEESAATSSEGGKVEIVPVPDVKLVIPEIKTSSGKDFDIPISLEDESIIFGVTIVIKYDSELLTPQDVTLGESFQDKGMDMAVDMSVPGEVSMEISGDGVTGSGSLVDMTFASDDVMDQEVAVDFESVTVTDANGEETSATTSSEGGKVEIVPLPDVKLAIPEIKATPGEDFDVAINLEDESILFGAKIELEYDNELVTLKEAKLGESFKDMEMAVDMTVPGKAVLDITGDGITGSGALVDMTFASDETADGETAVDLKNVIITDANGDETPATSLKSGKVKVTAACVDESFLKDKDKIGIKSNPWALLPERTMLLQNFPNPFNPETWIPYQLRGDSTVTLRIFNSQGQVVREIDLGHRRAGSYLSQENAAYWDGKDSSGQEVSSGIYFYNIQAGEFTSTKKMIMAR